MTRFWSSTGLLAGATLFAVLTTNSPASALEKAKWSKVCVNFLGLRSGASGTDMLLGCRADARSLRFGAEKELRRAARLETNPEKLVALVDRANQARPRTLF